MPTIDEIAYESPLRWINPGEKIIFGCTLLILCLCLNCYSVSLLLIFAMAFLEIHIVKIPILKYFNLMAVPFVFLVLGTITIVINRYPIGENVIFGLQILNHVYGVTAESMRLGSLIVLKALGAVSAMYFISVNTTMPDILIAARSMKIPLLVINLMELIYRYIFLLLEEAHTMRVAQISRLGYGKFTGELKALGNLTGTLFLRAYMRSDIIFSALESRGYEGEMKGISAPYTYSKTYRVWGSLLCLILLLTGISERLFV